MVNFGRSPEIVEFSAGATRPGGSKTIGVKTSKDVDRDWDPGLAPSSACARQKYVRAVASGSGRRRLVRPPSPGAILSREKTLFVKFASVAISNAYVSGRTPLLDAFSISNVIGC